MFSAQRPHKPVLTQTLCSYLLACLIACLLPLPAKATQQTLIVSAEGLADPQSEAYQRDKGLLLEALRRDAKQQLIEKAVGSYVESSTLVENYTLIQDRILTQSKGLIKRVIKESDPWIGKDGFAHLLMKAEVYLTDIGSALQQMSKTERVELIKELGNPKISVAVVLDDLDQSASSSKRSSLAENVLKKRLKSFGYRVWSEKISSRLKMNLAEKSYLENQVETTLSVTHSRSADFTILGQAALKSLSHTLESSGITLTKYALTSWTVSCVDNHTGEEVYITTTIPRTQSWSSKSAAIEAIGSLVGREFSRDFFRSYLSRGSQLYQLKVLGLPDYNNGLLLKKEFLGLREVLNVNFRNFSASGHSEYEVEFGGGREHFNTFLQTAIVQPLNRKLQENCFQLQSAHGRSATIAFSSRDSAEELKNRLETHPPSALSQATPGRLKELIHDQQTLNKVAEINPEATKELIDQGFLEQSTPQQAIEDF